MKTILTYCHLVLVVIFITTLIPFHAFHNHIADVHHVAMVSKNKKEHHCKLDENSCQESDLNHCKHQQHLAERGEKCFIGEFHFIKNITITYVNFNFVAVFKTHYFEQIITTVQNQITAQLNNKGPPKYFFI